MEEFFLILLLILISGIFSLSEMAIISARKSSLASDEKKGSRGAAAALRLYNNRSRFLSTVQIGNTLMGILIGLYSGSAMSSDIGYLFVLCGMSELWAYPVAQVIIIVFVTYLTIVFGELVPKRIALSMAEKASKVISRPMSFWSKLASPCVWILTKSTEGVAKMLGVKNVHAKVTEDDIRSIVQEGREGGEVQDVEQDIVDRVFRLGDLKVNTLMTHRSDIVLLDVNFKNDEVKKVLNESLHEAYPLTDMGFDNILGVVLLKDLIFRIDDKKLNLREIMTPAVYFYENMSIYRALEQMKEKRIAQAFICDEFGTFQGIITLRDILEGLVGTIDEKNDEPDIIKRSDSNSWLIDGQCSLYDFLYYFDMEDLYDMDQDYTTVAGLIIDHLKHIPQAGEKMDWRGFSMEVVDMDGVRIDKILVTKIENKPKEENSSRKEEEE